MASIINEIEEPNSIIEISSPYGVERNIIAPIFLQNLVFFGSAVFNIKRSEIIKQRE